MTGSGRRVGALVFAVLTVTSVATVGGLATGSGPGGTAVTAAGNHGIPSGGQVEPATAANASQKPHPKVSSSVAALVESASSSGGGIGIATVSEPRVTVRIETAAGRAGDVADLVEGEGGTVRNELPGLVVAGIPPDALSALTGSDAVRFIRRPVPVRPTTGSVTSEGLPGMNVTAELRADGINGSGVTVAVIDSGFDATNPEIANNVVDVKNFSAGGGSFVNRSGQHGTATSEVLVDTAPNVSLVLIQVSYGSDIRSAIDYLETQTEVDAVSMSLGISTGPFDGTSRLDGDIESSVSNGTAWFISAGNEGDGNHFDTEWRDGDGDGWLNFTATDETLAIAPTGPFRIDVNWDDYPATGEDYDVYLVNASGNPVASSTTTQTGSQPPYEWIGGTASGETYYLMIKRVNASGTADFDIFSSGTPLAPSTSGRSITRPATEETAITIGAAYYETLELQAFSSRGPTIDGRQKPDLVAPDGVSTSVYGPAPSAGFNGTSAAAPHAAGVGALLLDEEPSLTPAELQTTLEEEATQLRSDEPNSQTGHGLVDANGSVEALSTGEGGDGGDPEAGGGAIQVDSSGEDWPKFRHDLANAGNNFGADLGPTDQVVELWNVSMGGSVVSSPAVVDGTLYVGSDAGTLAAINTSTGAVQWTYSADGMIQSSPAVAGGTVFVGSEDGNVYAVDAATGDERWIHSTGGPVFSSPSVAGGAVFVGSDDDRVYALNASTGEEYWNVSTGGNVTSSPALGRLDLPSGTQAAVVVGSVDGHVYAINSTYGVEIWNVSIGAPVRSSPTVNPNTGGVAVGSQDGAVHIINGTVGQEVRSVQTGGSVFSSPALGLYGPAAPYLLVGSFNGTFHFINETDHDFGVLGGPVWSSPAITTSMAYVGRTGGNVTGIDLTDQNRHWHFQTGGPVISSPAVVDGVVYVGSNNGNVYALAEPSDALQYSNLSVSRSSVQFGTGVVVSATVENTAEDPVAYAADLTRNSAVVGAYGVDLYPNGSVVGRRTGTLDPGETATVTFTQLPTPGTTSFAVGGLDPVSVTAEPAWFQYGGTPQRPGGVAGNTGPTGSIAERWNASLGSEVTASPAVVGGSVFVGTDGGTVVAVNATTGQEEWTFTAPTSAVRASPAVTGGTVYVGTDDGTVYAIDAESGTEVWRTATDGEVSASPMAIKHFTVLVATENGTLYAMNPDDGSVRWADSGVASGPIRSSPAAVPGLAYFGSDDGHVYAVNTRLQTELWSVSTGSAVQSTPALDLVSNTLFVGNTGGELYAVNLSTGAVRWTASVGGEIESSPAVSSATDTVWVSTTAGTLAAYNTTTGSQRWSTSTPGNMSSSPAVAPPGILAVGSDDHRVYGFDADTGAELWNHSTGGMVRSSPAILDNVVYVGSDGGGLYALTDALGPGGDTTAPAISNAQATDLSDGDGAVSGGDTVKVNVTATDSGSGVDAVVADASAFGAGTVTLGDPDGDDRYSVTFSVDAAAAAANGTYPIPVQATDAAGNDNETPTNALQLSTSGDTTAPVVHTATAIDLEDGDGVVGDGDRVEVVVNATDAGVGIQAIFATVGDFGPPGPLALSKVPGTESTYNGTFRVDGANASLNGDYVVPVTVTDENTNRNFTETNALTIDIPGNFFTVSKKSVEIVEGPGSVPDLDVRFSGGLIQVQLRNPTDYELEGFGVTHDTVFRIDVTVNGTTPRVLLGTGHDLNWTRTRHANGSWTMSITASPAEEQGLHPAPNEWDGTHQANRRVNETVSLAVGSLNALSETGKARLNGSIYGTDAQAFGTPRYDDETQTVSVHVEAPHFTVSGANNTGFFDVLLTDAVLSDWGVSGADALNVTAMGSSAQPASSSDVPGGLRLYIPLHYSAGDVTISPKTPAGDTAVSLSPSSGETAIDGTTTFDVVVENASGGVGAHTTTVSLANGTVADIVDVQLRGSPGLRSVDIAEDNGSVTLDVATMDTNDTGAVTVATVTVVGNASGTTDVNLSVEALGNEDGVDYTVTRTDDATLTVTGVPTIGGFANPPTDPDGDGLYEDINGNGNFNIVDVQAMFANRDDPALANNPQFFDFSGGQGVTVVDVQALFTEETG